MGKTRKRLEELPPRKDRKSRTKRQVQTLVNNRNFQAREYFAKRNEHKDELKRLLKENSEAVKLIASLRAQLNETSHELAELKRKK